MPPARVVERKVQAAQRDGRVDTRLDLCLIGRVGFEERRSGLLGHRRAAFLVAAREQYVASGFRGREDGRLADARGAA